MSIYILGISAFYHDSAACLIKDGRLMSAVQEERFSRIKHDCSFPKSSIIYCLCKEKINIQDVVCVAFYDKPFVKFERILETYLSFCPFGLRSFLKAIPLWIKQKLWISEFIRKELNYKGKIIYPEHHESHASSAFYPSPFMTSAILTIDGVGEWATTSYGVGNGNRIELEYELRFPHSLGLLYSAFTYYLGFKVNSGEYKVMGLAPYGEPKYANIIFNELIDLKEDGSFQINVEYFDYCVGLTMINHKFNELFGGPPRIPESEITQKEMDIAKSIQVVTEEVMVKMAKHVYKTTQQKNLCLAGGVALNCVGNGKILKESPFKNIWIQPAAGDAGGALGAALFAWYSYFDNSRKINDELTDFQMGSLLGPEFSNEEIESYLKKNDIVYRKYPASELYREVAKLLDDQNVVGWFHGRMEFGPRALGSRSILGDARSPRMQSVMNLKIKFRESFRPFAPSILEYKAEEYFEMGNSMKSPYMLLTVPIKSEKRIKINAGSGDNPIINNLNIARSEIPAVTHVDYSARIQTVSEITNSSYYSLIEAFYERTGCPLLINTSFNIRGEPIVCTPDDAYQCFMLTNMDYLVLESCLIDKKEQRPIEDSKRKKNYQLD